MVDYVLVETREATRAYFAKAAVTTSASANIGVQETSEATRADFLISPATDRATRISPDIIDCMLAETRKNNANPTSEILVGKHSIDSRGNPSNT